MKERFLRDGLIYGGATLLTGMSNIVLVSVYTRAIDRPQYGAVEYINVLQLLIQVIVGIELTQAIARFYGSSESEAERRAYASTGFWTLVMAYGTVCLGGFLAADQLETVVLGGAIGPGVLRPALVSVFLAILFYVVRSQLRWELRPARYALASLVTAVTIVVLSIYLLLVLRLGVIGVFVASGAGHGLGVITCLIGLRRTYRWSFDAAKLGTMLRFSAPLMVSTLALFAAGYGDRFVIRATMSFDDLGIYAAGARVASVIALATAGFQLGAAPLIYRYYRLPETPPALGRILRLFMAGGLVGVLGLAAVAPELVALFATPAYAEASRVVPLLAMATILASGYIFLPGLTLHDMTTRFAAINIVAAAASLASITALAGAYGVVGAALGALCGAALGLAMHTFFSQRVYRLPVDPRRIAAAILIVLATVAFGWTIEGQTLAMLLARVGLSIGSAAVVVLVTLDAADRSMVARLLSVPFASSRPSIDA